MSMTGHRCIRCGMAWAGDTGPEERFRYITKFCPLCIEKFPVARTPLIQQAGKPIEENAEQPA